MSKNNKNKTKQKTSKQKPTTENSKETKGLVNTGADKRQRCLINKNKLEIVECRGPFLDLLIYHQPLPVVISP